MKQKREQEINRDDLNYETGNTKNTYDFEKCKTIISFVREIYGVFVTLNDLFDKQINFNFSFN